jgi:hypothetical protein
VLNRYIQLQLDGQAQHLFLTGSMKALKSAHQSLDGKDTKIPNSFKYIPLRHKSTTHNFLLKEMAALFFGHTIFATPQSD